MSNGSIGSPRQSRSIGEAHRTPATTLVNVSDTERLLSAIGGGALVGNALVRRSLPATLLAIAGGYLVYRGMSGYCPTYDALNIDRTREQPDRVFVQRTVTINQPAKELYSFWRNFENLPGFMGHLESVTIIDDRRSHWVVQAPFGTVEWDAEISEDRPNEFIAWRSTGNSDIEHAGSVRFAASPGDRGTEVTVTLEYKPPAGVVGAAVAKLFGEEPNQQVGEDLRRFKQVMEAGEVPTTEGQPSGRRSVIGTFLSPNS